MAEAFDREILADFHRRLLAGDRSTPNEFAHSFLHFMVDGTARKFPRVDEQIVHDGVIDAFLDFCANPTQFDPESEGSLEGFLLAAAWRNVANRREGERRLKNRERQVGSRKKEIDVADEPAARSIRQEEDRRRLADLAEIMEALVDPVDRQLFTLQMDGKRNTEDFAKLLQIEDLPIEQQRKEVKRRKDRIHRLLKRKGLLP